MSLRRDAPGTGSGRLGRPLHGQQEQRGHGVADRVGHDRQMRPEDLYESATEPRSGDVGR